MGNCIKVFTRNTWCSNWCFLLWLLVTYIENMEDQIKGPRWRLPAEQCPCSVEWAQQTILSLRAFHSTPRDIFLIQIERLGPALVTALWFVSWKTAYLVPSLYDKDMETTNAKTRPRIVGGWRTGKRIEHPSWQGIRPSMIPLLWGLNLLFH